MFELRPPSHKYNRHLHCSFLRSSSKPTINIDGVKCVGRYTLGTVHVSRVNKSGLESAPHFSPLVCLS